MNSCLSVQTTWGRSSPIGQSAMARRPGRRSIFAVPAIDSRLYPITHTHMKGMMRTKRRTKNSARVLRIVPNETIVMIKPLMTKKIATPNRPVSASAKGLSP